MTREKALQKADSHIRRNTDLVHDIAANIGQIVDNVKHMAWFREAIADELQENG